MISHGHQDYYNPDETQYEKFKFDMITTTGIIDIELDCDDGTMSVTSELGVISWKDMPKNVPISLHVWMYNQSTVTILNATT